jgi:hypothetical protein
MSRATKGSAAVVIPVSERLRGHRVTVARDEQGWWVGLEGSGVLECLPTLTQAIHRGLRLAHQHKPCMLTIHHTDGEQERHWFEAEEHPAASASL